MNDAEFRDKNEEQMIEYAVRMRERAERAEAEASQLRDAASKVLADMDEYPYDANGFNDDDIYEQLTGNQEALRAALTHTGERDSEPAPDEEPIDIQEATLEQLSQDYNDVHAQLLIARERWEMDEQLHRIFHNTADVLFGPRHE